MINAQFPNKLQSLFKPARYKVYYGGRGSGKSWNVARALLIIGAQRRLRILCAREFQNSIAESVHQLLTSQVKELGLESFYQAQQSKIIGANCTEFIFIGLRRNIFSLKSYEGVDIVWLEEAQTVSKQSYDVLIPTIRKEGSEIWVTFNPLLDTDETYVRFVKNPPAGAIVEKVNWSDNPWFPDVLQQEMNDLKAKDYDSYLNVWEGHCRQVLDGAVYANEIRAATEQGRIIRVPYEPSKQVHTFWDLGYSDYTAIWFAQRVGFEIRIIDYYQSQHQSLDHYLQVLQNKSYLYGTDYIPHDGNHKQLASGKSIYQLMKDAGRSVKVVPSLRLVDGINAARQIFPNCFFDSDKCADGLQCLRNYRYKIDEATGQYSKEPLHDWASHGADAFRYLAISLKEDKKLPQNMPRFANSDYSVFG